MRAPSLTQKERTKEIDSWKGRIAALGISQDAFASMEQMDKGNLSRWLNKKISPTDNVFWRIAGLLDELENDGKKEKKK